MIDRDRLFRQLEFASFAQRGQIAAELAALAAADDVDALLDGLDHPQPGVRLGVLELVRCARHRAAVARVLAHARAHGGDDRVFALRALADLARPGDDALRAAATAWTTAADPFVAAQAQRLAAATAPTDASGPARAPLDQLVAGLFAATRAAERMAGVDELERRGPAAVAATARLALAKGSAELVPLVVRALIRQAAHLPAPAALVPLLEAARRRLGDAPAAAAALDDALLALGGLALAPTLLRRLLELAPAQIDALVARLCAQPAPEVALQVPAMLDALGRRPAMWSSLGPALAYAAADVRDSARTELRRHADGVVAELRRGRGQPPVTVVSATWVLARLAEPGEPLPAQLRAALERLPAIEAAAALFALCARLATEAAATALLALARDPLPEARAAAVAALAAWASPWVAITADDPPRVAPRYRDGSGAALTRTGDRLVGAADDDHVLDGHGQPIRASAAEHGGCRCCAPPLALARARGAPACAARRRGCGTCATASGWCAPPTTRSARAIAATRSGSGSRSAPRWCAPSAAPAPRRPAGAPVGPAGDVTPHDGLDVGALPRPPTAAEFEHVAATIRAAMGANVFLHARDGDQTWNGSGIVIARDGDHVAILTNRHVVESDDQQRLCQLDAMTVAGQARGLRTVWRAGRGVDLALVEGQVGDADQLGVMALGGGAVLVGAEVFAIGNPLGLAWSYCAGTLSAVRTWTTPAGLSVRILQTDASIAPGSSGGGLWHQDGHLLGVMSFLRQGNVGGSAHFALSVEAIRDAWARDDLRWRGRRLIDLA